MKQVTTYVGIDAEVVRHLGGASALPPVEAAAAVDAEKRAHSAWKTSEPFSTATTGP